MPVVALLLLLVLVVLGACGEGPVEPAGDGDVRPIGETQIPPRRTSRYEVDVPYVSNPTAFWARPDLYVMRPDVVPAKRWPDEVLYPSANGIKIIVLLPGDYRARSNGRLPAGAKGP